MLIQSWTFGKDTWKERSLASEISCQGDKEAKVLSTHRAFTQKMNFCSWKGNRARVYKTNKAPSGSRSFFPGLRRWHGVQPGYVGRGDTLAAKVKEAGACFCKWAVTELCTCSRLQRSFAWSPWRAKALFARQLSDFWAAVCVPGTQKRHPNCPA